MWPFKLTFLFAFPSIAMRTQQANPPAQPNLAEAQIAQARPDSLPHLSEKDQSLACPANTETHPNGEGVYKSGESVKPPKAMNRVQARSHTKREESLRRGISSRSMQSSSSRWSLTPQAILKTPASKSRQVLDWTVRPLRRLKRINLS